MSTLIPSGAAAIPFWLGLAAVGFGGVLSSLTSLSLASDRFHEVGSKLAIFGTILTALGMFLSR